MEPMCLTAPPDAMMDLMRIRKKTFGKSLDDEKETLPCAICLCPISHFSSASCMSCVCEGVFHTECLERIQPLASHVLHGEERQCPYCRTVGSIVKLHKEVHRMCPPGGKRERVEKRLRLMWKLSPSARDTLEATERDIRKKSRHLGERLHALKLLHGGPSVYEGLLYPFSQAVATALPDATLCRKCGEGIVDFSDLTTQACHCNALYHSKCLSELVDATPVAMVPCCLVCKSIAFVPNGVSVKELMVTVCASHRGASTAPRTPSMDEVLKEASQLREEQAKCLARLSVHLKTVSEKTKSLKRVVDAAPSHIVPQKPKKTRLAYLPP